MRNKEKTRPEIMVRDPIFGEPKPLGGGEFEIAVTVPVQVGGKPAYGVIGQFCVNAFPVGNPQTVIDGKISSKIKVSGKRPLISIELKSDSLGNKIIPLREIDLSGGGKKGAVEIFGPCGDKKYFHISAQTEANEKIILNSTSPLTLSGIGVPRTKTDTSFILQGDDNGIISLKAITKKDAVLQFKKNNEAEKRLLVI